MLTGSTFIRGLQKGLSVTWDLSKVVIPIYFAVTFLKYTPVLPWISEHMAPFMHVVGLPGEAALPLVLGAFLNIYAAIGAMLPLGLSVKQITVMSAMLLLAHSLPVETAVNKKTGVRVSGLVLIRLGMAFLFGIFFNWIL